MIALLFPGQGSQTPGMLHRLPDHPAVRQTLEEVSTELRYDVLTLDTPEALHSTVPVQLSLLTVGIAAARALEAEDVTPEAVAGLSVGAFGAAVHAQVLSLAGAIRLVKQRAELMEQNSPAGYGLTAIVGLTEDQVAALLHETDTPDDPAYIANVNSAEQTVISGSLTAMEKISRAALKAGARKVERLDVAVLSHAPLLQPIAGVLTQTLQTIPLHPPRMVYIGNVKGRALRSADLIAADLANNIAHAVRWYETMIVLKELGCTLCIETPPGHVLTNLAKQSIPEVKSVAMAESSLSYVVQQVSRRDP
ncbi:MAG TPA: malonate decarboxylase subunit epsilon [Chthoniobacterales bacterium]|jgi:malonate decarboxylase epsilon subunit|nr:malonate decarboxylase subunit epsilon [Chthoniobacterales bacterium]